MLVRRYWQPFSEVNVVKQQLDQLFDDLTTAPSAPTTWTPAATLVESEEALSLHVQLPGVKADEIDIQASREVIAVSGQRPALEIGEGETLRRNEFRYGAFRRVVSLPVGIEPTGVSASYEAGILVLHLPKAEDVRNKVVKISVAGAAPAAIADSIEADTTETATATTADSAAQ